MAIKSIHKCKNWEKGCKGCDKGRDDFNTYTKEELNNMFKKKKKGEETNMEYNKNNISNWVSKNEFDISDERKQEEIRQFRLLLVRAVEMGMNDFNIVTHFANTIGAYRGVVLTTLTSPETKKSKKALEILIPRTIIWQKELDKYNAYVNSIDKKKFETNKNKKKG